MVAQDLVDEPGEEGPVAVFFEIDWWSVLVAPAIQAVGLLLVAWWAWRTVRGGRRLAVVSLAGAASGLAGSGLAVAAWLRVFFSDGDKHMGVLIHQASFASALAAWTTSGGLLILGVGVVLTARPAARAKL